jgi:TRAP-type transport system small permease protein
MRWLTALADVLDWLGRCVAGVLLIGLLTIVSLQFVDRHFISVPIAAPDAYARIMLLWVTFIGFALAVRAGLAIRVDLLDHWLSERVRAGLSIGFDVVKLGLVLLLVVKGWVLVDIGFDQAILGTDLTTAVPNAALWVSSLMLLVFVLESLLRTVTGRAGASPPVPAPLPVE